MKIIIQNSSSQIADMACRTVGWTDGGTDKVVAEWSSKVICETHSLMLVMIYVWYHFFKYSCTNILHVVLVFSILMERIHPQLQEFHSWQGMRDRRTDGWTEWHQYTPRSNFVVQGSIIISKLPLINNVLYTGYKISIHQALWNPTNSNYRCFFHLVTHQMSCHALYLSN